MDIHPLAVWLVANAHMAYVAATSWLAWRIYAVIVGILLFVVFVFVALKQREQVAEFSNLPMRIDKRVRNISTIRKRLDRLDEFEKNKIGSIARRAIFICVFGFLAPSLVLIVGILHYSWFFPNRTPLLNSNGCSVYSIDNSIFNIVKFMISQLMMGVEESRLTGNIAATAVRRARESVIAPADDVVKFMMVFYRYFIGLFTTILLSLFWEIRGAISNKDLKDLREDLEARSKAAGSTH